MLPLLQRLPNNPLPIFPSLPLFSMFSASFSSRAPAPLLYLFFLLFYLHCLFAVGTFLARRTAHSAKLLHFVQTPFLWSERKGSRRS
ncbi:hypothetical protein GQ54DRAFT_296059 [Martensiomyces pterosporus]|nr:hypothetical protein GQ54DRAFT_296059 [Martensiomyces pterosporus]